MRRAVSGNHDDSLIHLFLAIALIGFALSLAHFVSISLTSVPSFDGALNLNVSRSLVEGKGYGSYYNGYHLFPIETQTNAPYVAPAALAFVLGGIGVFTGQAVNLVYLVVFGAALYGVLRRLAGPAAALAAVLAVFQVPGLPDFGMNGYGEIPALAYLMLGLPALAAALSSGSAAAALAGGLAFGLSFLTKTVALIWVGPAALLFLLLILDHPARLRLAGAFLAGMALPVLAWEGYRLAALGGPGLYFQWWYDQAREILSQSGVHKGAAGFAKARAHLDALSRQTGVPAPVLVLFWLAPLPVAAARLRTELRAGNRASVLILGTLAGVALIYIVWWLFITPTVMAWLRRILDGLILQQAVAVLATASLLGGAVRTARAGAWASGAVRLALAAIVALPAGWLAVRGEVVTRPWPGGGDGALDVELAAAMRALPAEARIFGHSWWQAPVLTLFSGRDIDDLEKWPPRRVDALPGKYLVLDRYALALAPNVLPSVERDYALTLLHRSPAGALFRIDGVAAAGPDGLAGLSSAVLSGSVEYPHARGLFGHESDGWSWSRSELDITLRRTDQTRLAADVTIPDGVLGLDGTAAPDGRPLTLRLTAEGCGETALPVSAPGRRRIEAALSCPASPEGRPLRAALTLNSQLDPRGRGADQRPLAFIFHSIELLP